MLKNISISGVALPEILIMVVITILLTMTKKVTNRHLLEMLMI